MSPFRSGANRLLPQTPPPPNPSLYSHFFQKKSRQPSALFVGGERGIRAFGGAPRETARRAVPFAFFLPCPPSVQAQTVCSRKRLHPRIPLFIRIFSKKRADNRRLFLLAEREGFGPPESCPSTVFKTAAFDRSAISPKKRRDPCARYWCCRGHGRAVCCFPRFICACRGRKAQASRGRSGSR